MLLSCQCYCFQLSKCSGASPCTLNTRMLRESSYSKQDIKPSQEKVCDVAAVGTHFCEILGDALEWFGGKHTLLWQSRLLKGARFTISPAQTVWTHLLPRGNLNMDLPIWRSAPPAGALLGPRWLDVLFGEVLLELLKARLWPQCMPRQIFVWSLYTCTECESQTMRHWVTLSTARVSWYLSRIQRC